MNILKKLFLVTLLSLAGTGQAQEPPMTALATVQSGVQVLLSTVQESKPYFLTDQQRYFNDIESALSTIVDFDAVARVVMSRYAEAATDQQVSRFADILKTTLTRFYGSALASYNGQELVFIPSDNQPSDPRADRVVGMEIKGIGNGNGNGNGAFRLQYQMFLNENDEWKLKNLSLGGINLGRQYYTQFAAAMSQYDNDIDQVLDNWK
ncbi:MAG: ABC transporter substrate-binding protein [Gammaproteobacteria bacterium]|nr:ABC transporter substrate-binding protein [Pseudomonadales bacterium]MCP5345533.1 ABC transporter substrate-binding protein [Pseudomonadales bacterium]